jgi:hypothetical protein
MKGGKRNSSRGKPEEQLAVSKADELSFAQKKMLRRR